MKRRFLAALMLVTISVGCSQDSHSTLESRGPAPLFEGMGHHAMAITTDVSEAQQYFNQGLTWTYAFNHDEAIRSFETAAMRDPTCAMAYWGIALCHGPHINNPVMPPERVTAAWAAVEKARARRDHCGYIEQQLIDAISLRYAPQPLQDRRSLDEAYADAMKRAYELDVNNADIGTLYAESLMDLQPWDLWDKEGLPKGRTEEILAVLEHALKINPQHPGANHLYIHAVEASSRPERGVDSAQVLRNLVPISGHLVHMPSHIDVRIGKWAMATKQNEKAMEADKAYRKISPRQGFYSVYMAHNPHFLAWSSMMEGRYETGLKAAREMIAGIPESFMREQPAFVDPFMSIVLDVQKRFGKWDEVLKEPKPPVTMPISMAMWHFSRGIAFAAKKDAASARKEQELFRQAVKRVPQDALTGINPAHKVLSIAEHMLEGEIALGEDRLDDAAVALRKGVEIEDDLLYMEPPEWIQPVRHTLGAVLVKAKRFEEAEEVYRKDLKAWPENGWALHGLATCLKARGETAELKAVEARFKRAWERSDTNIETSCLCVRACCY